MTSAWFSPNSYESHQCPNKHPWEEERSLPSGWLLWKWTRSTVHAFSARTGSEGTQIRIVELPSLFLWSCVVKWVADQPSSWFQRASDWLQHARPNDQFWSSHWTVDMKKVRTIGLDERHSGCPWKLGWLQSLAVCARRTNLHHCLIPSLPRPWFLQHRRPFLYRQLLYCHP